MEQINTFFYKLSCADIAGKLARALDGFTEKCETETKAIRKAEKLMDQYSEMGLEIKKLMEKAINEAKQ